MWLSIKFWFFRLLSTFSFYKRRYTSSRTHAIYSQGLLCTLTQALQSSGVDLSEANISVQIDLGKRANTSRRDSSTPIFKKNEAPVIDENLTHLRLASTREEKSDNDLKRFKTSRN